MLSHFLDRLLDASSNGDLLVDSRAEGGDERAAAEGAGLTAGQWARTRKKWAASRVDVVRGFVQGYSPVDAALKLAVALLVAFSAYLAYCESCKEEHYAMVLALSRALRGAALAERGSLSFSVVLGLAVWLGTVLAMRRLRHRPVYLVDFKTYRHKIVGGPEANTAGAAATYEAFLRESRLAQHTDGSACFTKESLDFQERMLRTSCISERSVFPEGVIPDTPGKFGAEAERVALCMAGARAEAEQMMFRAVEDVLAATRTPPERIGVLVVNCSLFCPTPSLSAMLVNRFKMRADVVSYNLGGMGCSAGVIAIDLAKRLLKGTARALTARIRLRPPSPHSRFQTPPPPPPPHTHTTLTRPCSAPQASSATRSPSSSRPKTSRRTGIAVGCRDASRRHSEATHSSLASHLPTGPAPAGNERSMLLSNCLFRCGAAAILLSNRAADRRRARFQLLHTVRTHIGKNDEAYRSVYQEEDAAGIRGVRLSKQIMQIAGDALKSNIATLGPLVLPVSEQLKFVVNLVARRALSGKLPAGVRGVARALASRLLPWCPGYKGGAPAPARPPPAKEAAKPAAPPAEPKPPPQPAAAEATLGTRALPSPSSTRRDSASPLAALLPPYVPDFTRAFEWICVHTGGRAVIGAPGPRAHPSLQLWRKRARIHADAHAHVHGPLPAPRRPRPDRRRLHRRRDGEEPVAARALPRAVAALALALRQHVVGLDLVRARDHLGARQFVRRRARGRRAAGRRPGAPAEARRQGVADRLRLRLQVQLGRVEVLEGPLDRGAGPAGMGDRRWPECNSWVICG